MLSFYAPLVFGQDFPVERGKGKSRLFMVDQSLATRHYLLG